MKKSVKKSVKKMVVKKVAVKQTPKPKLTISDKVVNQFKELTASKPYADFIKIVDILNQRYASEKKYESFDSYIELVKKYIPSGLTMDKMTKKAGDFFIKMNYEDKAVVLVNVTPRATYTNILMEKF